MGGAGQDHLSPSPIAAFTHCKSLELSGQFADSLEAEQGVCGNTAVGREPGEGRGGGAEGQGRRGGAEGQGRRGGAEGEGQEGRGRGGAEEGEAKKE